MRLFTSKTKGLKHFLLAASALMYLFCPLISSADDKILYLQKELIDFYRGSAKLQLSKDLYISDIGDVYRKLESYSKKTFRVIPAQTFNIGQAHAGGLILIDVSMLAKNKSVFAWALAHEWAHECLDHQPNLYNVGTQWRFRRTPTEFEDEADKYAAEFIAHFNYAVEPVIQYLNNLPNFEGDFEHSSGGKRAAAVKKAYNAYKKANGNYIIKTRKQECLHTKHPYDISPITGMPAVCVHQMHDGDTEYYWVEKEPAKIKIGVKPLPPVHVPTPHSPASITIWIDDIKVGTIHNFKNPNSVKVDQFQPGSYPYKLHVLVTNVMTGTEIIDEEGSIEIENDAVYRVSKDDYGIHLEKD